MQSFLGLSRQKTSPELTWEGLEHYKHHQVESALSKFQSALNVREQRDPESLKVAEIYHSAGCVLYKEQVLAHALKYFQRALKIRGKKDPNSLDMALTCNNVGKVLREKRDFEGAKWHFKRALNIREQHDPNSTVVAQSCINIGLLLKDDQDFDGAQQFFQRVLAIHERNPLESFIVDKARTNIGIISKMTPPKPPVVVVPNKQCISPILTTDDFFAAIVGPVQLSILEGSVWSKPNKVLAMVQGVLYWIAPCYQAPTLSDFEGENCKQLDLVRGETRIKNCVSDSASFEVESPCADYPGGGMRCVRITASTEEEAAFWKNRISLFTKSWQDLITTWKETCLVSPETVTVLHVVEQERAVGDNVSQAGDSGSAVIAAMQKIRQVFDQVLNGAINVAQDANATGLTRALAESPMAGVGFAIIGYGLMVIGRYKKNERDLPVAYKRALNLFAFCVESILSLKGTEGEIINEKDKRRQERMCSFLGHLETAIHILDEEHRKTWRAKTLDAIFKGQGGSTKVFEITLNECEKDLVREETHATLLGVDSVRHTTNEILNKVTMITEGSNKHTPEETNEILSDIRAQLENVIKGREYTPALLSATLLDDFRKCRTINDIDRMYYSDPYQKALGRIEHAQGERDKEEWAREWAVKLRNKEDEAFELNKDRKVCLELLKVLVQCWRDGNIQEEDIIGKPFEGWKKVARILGSCLVMDRAQCLYVMRPPGASTVGMHWYSKQHEESDEFRDKVKKFRKRNEPTLSSKFVQLLDYDELKLRREPLQKWSEPVGLDEIERDAA